MNPRNFFAELKRNLYRILFLLLIALFTAQSCRRLGDDGATSFQLNPVRLTENQISGNLASMKTTLDLPDELMREVKIRAVHEHKKK